MHKPGNSQESQEKAGKVSQIPGKAGIRKSTNSLIVDDQHQTSPMLIFAYPTSISIAFSYAFPHIVCAFVV